MPTLCCINQIISGSTPSTKREEQKNPWLPHVHSQNSPASKTRATFAYSEMDELGPLLSGNCFCSPKIKRPLPQEDCPQGGRPSQQGWPITRTNNGTATAVPSVEAPVTFLNFMFISMIGIDCLIDAQLKPPVEQMRG